MTMTEDEQKGQPRDEGGRFASQTSSDGENTELDNASGFSINFAEIPDETTQKAVKQLLSERDQLKSEVSEIKSMMSQMNEREQRLQLEKVKAEKLSELKEIDPRLAEKHKQETDIDKLDLLIDTAKSFKSNFAEYKKEDEGEKPRQLPLRRDLMSGDFV